MSTFASRLKDFRRKYGLTQEDFVRIYPGVTLSTLRNWEQQRRRVAPNQPAEILMRLIERDPVFVASVALDVLTIVREVRFVREDSQYDSVGIREGLRAKYGLSEIELCARILVLTQSLAVELIHELRSGE